MTKLAIGDRLRVSVPELFAPGQTATVTPLIEPDGKVSLLLIKPVAAVDFTDDQLADNIAQAYSDAHVLSNADVKVERIEHPGADAPPRKPLAAGDRVRVRVWDLEAPGTETTLRRKLDDRGSLALPHLKGVLKLSDLSERDAATRIAQEYRQQGVLLHASVEVIAGAE